MVPHACRGACWKQPSASLHTVMYMYSLMLIFVLDCSGAPSAANRNSPLHRPAWQYQPATPPQLLDRVRDYTGDDSRMRAFAARLLLGLPTKIVWLGGSVSMNIAAPSPDTSWVAMWHRWMEAAFTSCGDVPGQDPKAPLHQALNVQHYLEHKRLCNSSSVEMDNMAVFASTVEFMELCQFQRIPQDANLVVLELAVNDVMSKSWEVTTPSRRAFERMIRAALALPSKPAVLLFETYSWYWAAKFNNVAQLKRFTFQQEDMHTAFARYYGNVQVLTARSLMYHTMMAHPENRKLGLFTDDIHLTALGHVLYSDILIHYTRQYVRQLYMEHALCEERQGQGGDASSSSSSNGGVGSGSSAHIHHASLEVCSAVALAFADAKGGRPGGPASATIPYGSLGSTYVMPGWEANVQFYTAIDQYSGAAAPGELVVEGPLDPELPPPMLHGNEVRGRNQGMCAYSEELPAVVAFAGPEWEFKDETGGTKRKFGFISFTPDSELYMRVPLDDPDARAEAEARVAALKHPTPEQLEKALVGASTVNLVYLSSQSKEMGMALMNCVGACSCKTKVVNGWNTMPASIMQVTSVAVYYAIDLSNNTTHTSAPPQAELVTASDTPSTAAAPDAPAATDPLLAHATDMAEAIEQSAPVSRQGSADILSHGDEDPKVPAEAPVAAEAAQPTAALKAAEAGASQQAGAFPGTGMVSEEAALLIPDRRRALLLEQVNRGRRRHVQEAGAPLPANSRAPGSSGTDAGGSTAFTPMPGKCYLQIKVMNDTYTGGHKFKVIGIIVGANAGDKERMKMMANAFVDDKIVAG